MKKTGRPKKPAAQKMSRRISVYVTPAEGQLLRRAYLASDDRSLADWVRRVCLAAAREQVKP